MEIIGNGISNALAKAIVSYGTADQGIRNGTSSIYVVEYRCVPYRVSTVRPKIGKGRTIVTEI